MDHFHRSPRVPSRTGIGRLTRWVRQLRTRIEEIGHALLRQPLLPGGRHGAARPRIRRSAARGWPLPALESRVLLSNMPPVLDNIGPDANYVENSTRSISPTLTVADADSPDFDGGSLVVQIFSGGSADDRLVIRPTPRLTIDGANLEFDGQAIGSFSGGVGLAPLVVDLTAGATAANVQTLIRHIGFSIASNAPTAATRTIAVTLFDGDGPAGTVVVRDFHVLPVDDLPAISQMPPKQFFIEDRPPLLVAPQAIVADPDGLTVDQLVLSARIIDNADDNDALFFQLAAPYSTVGSQLRRGGQVIGMFSGGTGAELTVVFNDQATQADVQAILRGVAYQSQGEVLGEPGPGGSVQKLVQFSLAPAGGGVSRSAPARIIVVPHNDAPVVSDPGSTPTYVENALPLAIFPAARVSDVDSGDFDGGQIRVQILNHNDDGDRLSLALSSRMTLDGDAVLFDGVAVGTFVADNAAGTLIVSLNGEAVPSTVEHVLRQVRFHNATENPAAGERSIRLRVTDGDGGTSHALTKEILVQPVNDPPVLVPTPGNTLDPTQATPQTVDNAAVVTDADSPNFDGGELRVRITEGEEEGDLLTIAATGPLTLEGDDVLFNGTVIGTKIGGAGRSLVVRFNAQATPQIAQAVLRRVTFTAAAGPRSTPDLTLQVRLTDGDGGVASFEVGSD